MTSIAAQPPNREANPRTPRPALDAPASPEGRAQWRQIGRALDRGTTPTQAAQRLLGSTAHRTVYRVRTYATGLTHTPVRRALIAASYYQPTTG